MQRPLRQLIAIVLMLITEAKAETPDPKHTFEGLKAGDSRELVTAMTFRWCPPGKFTMGSPPFEHGRNSFETQQEEVLGSGYWLQETEVTQGQWKSLMGTTPWNGEELVQSGSDYAASYISQESAVEFCQRLTKREQSAGQLPNGWIYALPSEAQWEYACRAGTTTAYSFGDNESKLNEHAWWGGISGDGNTKSEQYAHPVGRKKPNAWGLKDMYGNLWEWCSDESWPESRSASATELHHRVYRGGSWGIGATKCRSASRARLMADSRNSFIGFRVAAIRSLK